ncbi:MAG: hypothetical protein ACOCSD_08830 [Halolamina sp.]
MIGLDAPLVGVLAAGVVERLLHERVGVVGKDVATLFASEFEFVRFDAPLVGLLANLARVLLGTDVGVVRLDVGVFGRVEQPWRRLAHVVVGLARVVRVDVGVGRRIEAIRRRGVRLLAPNLSPWPERVSGRRPVVRDTDAAIRKVPNAVVGTGLELVDVPDGVIGRGPVI